MFLILMIMLLSTWLSSKYFLLGKMFLQFLALVSLKTVCACLQRCKTVRIRSVCIAKAYFVLTFQWLRFDSFTWGKLVAKELDGKHYIRFMTHHTKSVPSTVYPDSIIKGYFTVGERVRFLFTTSEYKTYKRANREITYLLYTYRDS